MTGTLTDPIPSWHIDASHSQGGGGFEAWLDYARPFYDARAPGGVSSFAASATGYQLDQLMFVRSVFEQLEVGRSRRHLESEPSEFLTINIFRRGGFMGLIDEIPIMKRPNEVVLQDASRSLRAIVDRSDVLAVIVPYSVMGFDPSKHRPWMALPAESAKGRVLANMTQDIFDRLPEITGEEAPAIAAGYAGMLRGIFMDSRTKEDQRSLRRAVRSAMVSFVDAHLNDPKLGADLLCKTFGLSRASLYRLFQCQGGVNHTIQQRRLFRCYQDLGVRGRETTVRSIGERYGFTNASHFTKVFKSLFFISPSEVGSPDEPLFSARRALSGDNQAAPFALHDWLYRTCGFSRPANRDGDAFRAAAE